MTLISLFVPWFVHTLNIHMNKYYNKISYSLFPNIQLFHLVLVEGSAVHNFQIKVNVYEIGLFAIHFLKRPK